MYFLSEQEKRLLLRRLLPQARDRGIAEELRGWNWDKPPLSPIYD
ncbi:MAG: type I-A CRISPR-associated protein Cas4/Csa1, partial [Chloroflexi bacterium]